MSSTSEITGVSGNENGPHRTTGVQDDDHEDGSGDHDESTVERSGGDEITGDSIAEHMDTVTAEDIAMHTDVDGDDGWDAQTVNESLTGNNVTRVGGDNDNDNDNRRNSDDNPSPTGSETEIQASMDERYGARSGCYNLRPWQERNANGWNALLFNTSPIQQGGYIQGITLRQYNVKQGLKIFGKQVN